MNEWKTDLSLRESRKG